MKSTKQLFALSLLLSALMVGGGLVFRRAQIKNSGPALYVAASLGRNAEALSLIESGVPVNFVDSWSGETPLHAASECGNDALVMALLAHGAKIEVTSKNGATPLMCAAFGGQPSTVKLLLSKGANTQPRDEFGLFSLQQLRSRLGLPRLSAQQKVAYPQIVAILQGVTRVAK